MLDGNSQIIQQYDQSGKTLFNAYDFKGNLLSLTKQLCQDYKNVINWDNSPTLEQETFDQSFTYDAMNRLVEITKPDNSVEQYEYNKAGLLESIKVKIRGAATATDIVTNINYNEKGQRTDIYYDNGSKTKYEYDTNTFRLNRLLTTRNTGSDILQDINYTYDPEGNITGIKDNAQQTFYYSNSVIKPIRKYYYDALYRLTKARGRELTSLSMPTHNDFTNNIPVPNTAANALQNYTQQYTYDELGNIQQMQSVGNWTRDYYYETANNRLKNHDGVNDVYSYDEHGNVTAMPHLSTMNRDHKNQLKDVDLGGGGTAYYTYDASGERTRKVIVKTGGIVEQRIYLGGYEVYRKTISGSLDFERETLRISDDRKAIVDIETKTVENGSTIGTPTSNLRFQYDNHLGSACLELDSSAAIISYEEYHPFGTTSYRSGRTETEVSLKRYKYVGKERDEETGLYYYGARYYAGWIARFVSVDPLQFEYPYYTPYQYAGNKPISYIDLDGLEEVYLQNGKSRPSPLPEEYIKNNSIVSNKNPISPFNKTVNNKNDKLPSNGNARISNNQENYHNGSEGDFDYEPDFKLSFSTEIRGGNMLKFKACGYGFEKTYGISNTVTSITYGIDTDEGITVEEKTFFGKDAYRKPLSFYIDALTDPNTLKNTEISASYGRGIGSVGGKIDIDNGVVAEGGLSPGIKGEYNILTNKEDIEYIIFDVGVTVKNVGFNIKLTSKEPIVKRSEENSRKWVDKAQENVNKYGSIVK